MRNAVFVLASLLVSSLTWAGTPGQKKLPELISMIKPEFPLSEHVKDEEGLVELSILISAAGTVDDVRVYNSSGSTEFDASAIKAAKTAKFHPAEDEKGVPESVRLRWPIVFKRPILDRKCSRVSSSARFIDGKEEESISARADFDFLRGFLVAKLGARLMSREDNNYRKINAKANSILETALKNCVANPNDKFFDALSSALDAQ